MTSIEAIDGAHVVGVADSLLMCLWRGVTTRGSIAELQRIAAKHRARYPAFGMLTVVEAGADMPDSTVRADLAALFRSLGDSVACSALVFEGEGFKAATVRGITTGINLLARQPFPHKVFGDVEAGAVWMSGYGGPALNAVMVTSNFSQLRKTLDAHIAAGGAPARHP